MDKKFVACMFIDNGKAVKSFTDHTIIFDDPVRLAEQYSDDDADALLLFDVSAGENHIQSLLLYKDICDVVNIPVYGGGHINSAEDVADLFTAGCEKVVLNFGKECHDLLRQVADAYGRNRIAVSIASADNIVINKAILEENASELVLIDEHALKNCLGASTLPCIVFLPEISLDKLLSMMEKPNVSGLSGNIVNENCKVITALKSLCRERGISVHSFEAPMAFSEFKLLSDGLIPVVVQDYKNLEVLMVAYMNREAFEKTVESGKMTYWSRSRNELWQKGATSGHVQYVKQLSIDCDNDTILAKVQQIGAACHTGNRSCFYREILKKDYHETNPAIVFDHLYKLIEDRKQHPKEGSYTNYLLEQGIDKILKKVGEEATEIIIAAKNPNPEEIKYEISDFLYHVMVLMSERGVTWDDITRELANR